MNKDSEEYKQGFKDGMIQARMIMYGAVDINISFYDLIASIKFKGDNGYLFKKQEEKKNEDFKQ